MKLKRLPEPTIRAYYEEIEKNNQSQAALELKDEIIKTLQNNQSQAALKRKDEIIDTLTKEIEQLLAGKEKKLAQMSGDMAMTEKVEEKKNAQSKM